MSKFWEQSKPQNLTIQLKLKKSTQIFNRASYQLQSFLKKLNLFSSKTIYTLFIKNESIVIKTFSQNILKIQQFRSSLESPLSVTKTLSYLTSKITHYITSFYSKKLNSKWGLLLLTRTGKSDGNYLTSIINNFSQFVSIWPFHQWVSSLVTLILLYIWFGKYYNRKLAASGGWISIKTRVYMIIIDLIINLVVGMHYMSYRETLMGEFMMQCPIAISPFIFLFEFIIVAWYYKKFTLPKEKALQEKNSVLSHKNLPKDNSLATFKSLGSSSNINLEKKKISFISKENYEPRPLMETRFSILLQKTFWKKIQAAIWQWSRWGRILPEPQGKEREDLKQEIDFRYEGENKKVTQSSTGIVKKQIEKEKK